MFIPSAFYKARCSYKIVLILKNACSSDVDLVDMLACIVLNNINGQYDHEDEESLNNIISVRIEMVL